MIFTRIAWVAGLAVFTAMCWLGIEGFKPVVPLIVTAVALVALIAGGNVIGGRSGSRGRGGARSSDPGGRETPT